MKLKRFWWLVATAPVLGMLWYACRPAVHETTVVKALAAPGASVAAAEVAPRAALEALGYLSPKVEPKHAAPRPAASPSPSPAPDGALSSLERTASPQYLIRNARVSLEVEDVRARANEIAEAVQAAGGYISNMDDATSPLGEARVNMQIRLPATALDPVLARLDGWGRVLSREVSTQDVSREYIDTEARGRNLKKTEERLLEHLGRSATLENTIKLESELTRVREQIEVLDGRLRYLGNQVTYATLMLGLTPKPMAQPITPPDTFSTAREFTSAAREVIAFGQDLWAGTIWLGVWGVVWAPLALIALWAARKLHRRGVFTQSFRMIG